MNSLSKVFLAVSFLAFCNAADTLVSAQQSNAPQTFAALMGKGQSLLGQGNMAAAEKAFRDALEKMPTSAGAKYLLGHALKLQQKYGESIECFKESAKSQQFEARSLFNLSAVHAVQGKKGPALKYLDQAVAAGFSNFGQLEADPSFKSLMDEPRFKKHLPKKLTDNELFVEKSRIIHKWVGENAGDQFGWTARRAGDLDKDGVLDFVATAPTYNRGAGKIYVYSGKTGKELFSVAGNQGDRLGNSAVGVGDVDGDGIPDILAGAPASDGKGKAFLYSGKDGKLLRTFAGKVQGGQFGYEVTEAGDLNGDKVPDLLVGEMTGGDKVQQSGRVFMYSGKNGETLFELTGERQGDCFGNAAAIQQVKPGEYLLAIGAQNAGDNSRGRVYVYSVKSGKPSLKFKIEGDQNSVNLGQMFISFPGDLNRDGVPDVYASDFSDNTKVPGGGKVVVHSGSDGKELLAIHGKISREGLGTSPSDAGDVNGDGIGDLIIGAWQNSEGAASGGKCYLYSCADGKLLDSWTCKQSGDTLGFDACGIGDVDGDGNIDFLLTSAWSNARGAKTGRVFIVAGKDYSQKK